MRPGTTPGPQVLGRVDRHPVKPSPHAHPTDRSRLPGQDQKHSLKRIFGIVFGAGDSTAGGPHRGCVAEDEKFERGRVPFPNEPTQKVGVRDVVAHWCGGQESERKPVGHGRARVGTVKPSPILTREQHDLIHPVQKKS